MTDYDLSVAAAPRPTLFSMLGLYAAAARSRPLNPRPIWFTTTSFGLLWSARNPLMGQRPRSDRTHRRRAQGRRQFIGLSLGRKETKKKVNVREGSKALPPGIQWVPTLTSCFLMFHSTIPGEFIKLLQDIFPPPTHPPGPGCFRWRKRALRGASSIATGQRAN